MAIDIKSYNQILGQMVRKLIADTPVNDVNVGSVLLTLLESAAQVDFENSASILSVLELLNIDAINNSDLDARGADYGLTRITAQRSNGFVTIKDSTITKRSTGLYQVKNPPIAGSTTLYVNNAADWANTGSLFIGRGTNSFEGPVSYTSIVDNGSFYTITLAAALQKDHLISDSVIDAQGTTDRLVQAGTTVYIPANSLNPLIEFRTLRDAVMPAGEDTIDNVAIISSLAGASNNASANTITNFTSVPFAGATVYNTTALSDARDVESGNAYRERIKSYANTLARGTSAAIISSVIGVSDADDGRQVASASITEPPKVGDPSILYIDDGSGFEPSFVGQTVDVLLNSASGNEEFLQLSNFPVPRPQAINTTDGPFELKNGMRLLVRVDGVEEEVVFSTTHFSNIASATIAEIIIAINDQSETFKATFTSNSSRILLFPVDSNAETIQVAPAAEDADLTTLANSVIKFPTNEYSYIYLYQNSLLLKEKVRAASLSTVEFPFWNIIAPGNLVLSVDGTPPQDRTFTTNDFGGATFTSLSIDNWVTVFNAKYAGITATATSSGRLLIVSNKEGTASTLVAEGGTYLDILFSGQPLSAAGQNSDFQLNRQTGNLRILRDIVAGDRITAGTEDTKGELLSIATSTGTYNVAVDANGRPAEMVIVADADVTPRTDLGLEVGQTLVISDEGSNVMRIMASSLSSLSAAQPNDYVYIGVRSSWIDPANTGLFKIIKKGEHTAAGVDSYIDVHNFSIVAGSYTVLSINDLQIFGSEAYPQLWKGSFTATPAAATIQNIIDTINTNLINVSASVLRTNTVKITSTTEGSGSIALPISAANATTLLDGRKADVAGNAAHIANRVATKDMVSYFTITEPVDQSGSKPVWLDRVTYGDTYGELTENTTPGTVGIDTYSEELQATGGLAAANVQYDDVINNIQGNNAGQYRSIRDKLAGDRVGTQHELPRTIMKYTSGDTFNLMRPNSINAEDSIVLILDQDAIVKTIDVKMSRTGRVSSSFPPTDLSFSAYDSDNEPGTTFATIPVWGKTNNKTEFKNYAAWFRSRNWYVSGGAGSGGGALILRNREYGPHGDAQRFQIEYPTLPLQANTISHQNRPDYTLSTYKFGSDVLKSTGASSGDQVSVTALGGNDYRYTFLNLATDLSTVVVGDLLSALPDVGFSAANRGQFRIKNVNDALKFIDVYNPNGSPTGVGTAEVTTVATIADVIGSKTVSIVSGVLAEAAISDNDFLTINDSAGVVAVVYDKNSSVGTPASYGANRIIVVQLSGGESATTVAALTAGAISADSQFDASVLSTTITITNAQNGSNAVAADGSSPTGFGFAGTVGSANTSLDGKFFIVRDAAGSVAVWYDATGVTNEPLHGASRSIRVVISAGDSANLIAITTAVALAADAAFASATVLANVITLTDAVNGGRTNGNAGTSGFTVAQLTSGVNPTPETISISTSLLVFSLLNTAVADIVAKINADSKVLYASLTSGTNPIVRATRDEEYTPAGPSDFSLSLAYGHSPDDAYVQLYDGLSWVKQFENSAPNFLLKKPLVLQGVAPTAYSLDTATNHDTADLGEFFKLVPVTLNNVLHHFTQKALSQLPIVADVAISNNIRKIQIKSKKLGSDGAVEVVGGNANAVALSIFGEGQTVSGISKNFLEVKTAAFPITLTKGDYVEVKNSIPAKRSSRLALTDTIDVLRDVDNDVEYRWNHKDTQINQYVKFAISDMSATYGRPASTVWRWTHSDSGSVFSVIANANGLASQGPMQEIAAGITATTVLKPTTVTLGSVSTKQQFTLTVSGLPSQADYFTFRSATGVTFAAWFDVDNVGTAPTGASYVAATNKIEVNITSSDTEDQIVSALSIALLGNVNFTALFTGTQSTGANLNNVQAGDLLCAYGTFSSPWKSTNLANRTGDGEVSGLPIIGVGANYVDVLNPNGVAMASTTVGSAGNVKVVPTPSVRWNLGHKSSIAIDTIVFSSGTVATITTLQPHHFSEGQSVIIQQSTAAQTVAVGVILSPTSFTIVSSFVSPGPFPLTYSGGVVIAASSTPTRYAIESLRFNNLFRLRHVDGDAPRFIDFGVAVDDTLTISGSTFESRNNGSFRILGVSENDVIFQNPNGSEQLNTVRSFNDRAASVTWVSGSNIVSGLAGNFFNLAVGEWVKKADDSDTLYAPIVAILDSLDAPTTAALAVKIQLGYSYAGTSATSLGVTFDQTNDTNKGSYLRSMDDVKVYEGDSALVGDTLFIDNIANVNWFSSLNSGTFEVQSLGSTADCRPFVRISNSAGVSETARAISVSPIGFFLLENPSKLYASLRRVEHTSVDPFNDNRRSVYLVPAVRVDKTSQSYGTQLVPTGKLGYTTDVTAGIDGYTYYTGLMRTVQRIVDGFEPDAVSYPGRRAIGGSIETMASLIKKITMILQVTTNEGVNLNDISDDIKSAVINYIGSLGVGQDVILAEAVVRIMGITGVEAVVVSAPLATVEGRIPVSDNERAYIQPDNISVA